MKKEYVTDAVDLDMVLATLCDVIGAAPEDSKFNFLKINDHRIMTQIKKYSRCIKDKNFADMDNDKAEQFYEEECADILDAVNQANFDFFINGVRLGAQLLAEMLF